MHAAARRSTATTRAIRVSPEMVDAALKTVPASFVLHGRRDPGMDLLIERDRVYYGMGGTSEPMFWDYDLWRPRQPTKADMVASTRIGHALPNIDFVQTLCMSGDMPTDQIFFHDFDAIFRNTTKPTVLNILERPFTQLLLGMAAAASGGEEALREQPSMLGIVTPVSPLKIAVMNEGIIDAVEAGIPILYSPGPMMGATGPATVAGTLALTTAEVLFGVVLTQLIKPGRQGGAQAGYRRLRHADDPVHLRQPRAGPGQGRHGAAGAPLQDPDLQPGRRRRGQGARTPRRPPRR